MLLKQGPQDNVSGHGGALALIVVITLSDE